MAMDTRTELECNMAASEEVFPRILILSILWIAGGLMTRRLACFLFILESKSWLATCQYRESAEENLLCELIPVCIHYFLVGVVLRN